MSEEGLQNIVNFFREGGELERLVESCIQKEEIEIGIKKYSLTFYEGSNMTKFILELSHNEIEEIDGEFSLNETKLCLHVKMSILQSEIEIDVFSSSKNNSIVSGEKHFPDYIYYSTSLKNISFDDEKDIWNAREFILKNIAEIFGFLSIM
jgi:hypothetical protein